MLLFLVREVETWSVGNAIASLVLLAIVIGLIVLLRRDTPRR